MEIQETVSGIQSFSGLLPIAQGAEIKSSFWWGPSVSVSGYEGNLDIEALAGRVIELWKQNNYEFSEVERSSGRLLAKRIDYLYEENDRHWDNTNCLVKTFLIVVGVIYGVICCKIKMAERWRWAQGPSQLPNDDFEYYTQTQLRTAFGITPEEAKRRGFFSNRVDGIRRWHPPIVQVSTA